MLLTLHLAGLTYSLNSLPVLQMAIYPQSTVMVTFCCNAVNKDDVQVMRMWPASRELQPLSPMPRVPATDGGATRGPLPPRRLTRVLCSAAAALPCRFLSESSSHMTTAV
jgi:hypothetical protein